MFLEKTCTTYIRFTVVREVLIGDKRGVTWGMGESKLFS